MTWGLTGPHGGELSMGYQSRSHSGERKGQGPYTQWIAVGWWSPGRVRGHPWRMVVAVGDLSPPSGLIP